MSVEILEIKSHLTNATNELTKCADYTETKDCIVAIISALADLKKAEDALDALDFTSSENLRGL